MEQPQRVGVYGGTFDPIHNGHLAIAEEARAALGLDTVLFIPAVRQPLKDADQGAAPAHRLAMVHLACADNHAFVPDDIELRRPPPSYTVDTLEALRGRLDPAAEVWFVLGADAARDLPRWRRVGRILALARIAVVGRPGVELDPAGLERALPELAGRHAFIPGPGLEISSTDLRRRLAEGRPVRYQLPDAVLRYIAEHRLYRAPQSEGRND